MSTSLLACVLCLIVACHAKVQPRSDCTVTSFDQLEDAISSCTEIVINGLTVPAETTLDLQLNDGTSLTFEGEIVFEYAEWKGPLMKISGSGIKVKGADGHVLNGQGELYWDGKGDSGKTKPKFFRIEAKDGSTFDGINILNCPKQCVSIGNSDGLTVSNFNIDVSAGDIKKGGHNTDGFDVSSSSNVVVQNCVVKNQDDCVAVNSGSNLKFTGMTCSGGHGLSLSVGQSKNDSSANVLSDVTFSDSTVSNSRNGIHVKTHTDAANGSITDVTYSNIKLENITRYGINIQEDYKGGSSSGKPLGNIPITNLVISDVTGTMTGSSSIPVYILCGDDGCSKWVFSNIDITGARKNSSCNFEPVGYTC